MMRKCNGRSNACAYPKIKSKTLPFTIKTISTIRYNYWTKLFFRLSFDLIVVHNHNDTDTEFHFECDYGKGDNQT